MSPSPSSTVMMRWETPERFVETATVRRGRTAQSGAPRQETRGNEAVDKADREGGEIRGVSIATACISRAEIRRCEAPRPPKATAAAASRMIYGSTSMAHLREPDHGPSDQQDQGMPRAPWRDELACHDDEHSGRQ